MKKKYLEGKEQKCQISRFVGESLIRGWGLFIVLNVYKRKGGKAKFLCQGIGRRAWQSK
jgi:hypothetical protein